MHRRVLAKLTIVRVEMNINSRVVGYSEVIQKRAWRRSTAISSKPTSGPRRWLKVVPGPNFRVARDPTKKVRARTESASHLRQADLRSISMSDSTIWLQMRADFFHSRNTPLLREPKSCRPSRLQNPEDRFQYSARRLKRHAAALPLLPRWRLERQGLP